MKKLLSFLFISVFASTAWANDDPVDQISALTGSSNPAADYLGGGEKELVNSQMFGDYYSESHYTAGWHDK